MPARVAVVRPPWAIESGRITIEGSEFPIDQPHLPKVHVGGAAARVVFASPTRIGALVPPGLAGGPTPIRIDDAQSETSGIDVGPVVDIAAPFATGLHQVDNPVFDREGNLYVTYSGTRGQRVPVSIFRVRPNGTRETFCSGLVNPTSMALGPEGDLYVSSRFEGTVYRVMADGSISPFATDLGVPCGLAFDREGTLFVGDRSGTIFRVDRAGQATTHASVPLSVAAFHLAFGPDEALYVTAPTLSPYDSVFRIDRDGAVSIRYTGFGRPQGLAFDRRGDLFVVEALAGVSGLYRLPSGDGDPELMLSGPSLVGVAFGSNGTLVVCSNDTAYRLSRSG
jgi:sugar lactone lactonase YvrE